MPRALWVLCLLLPRLATADVVRGWEVGGEGELATRTSTDGSDNAPAVAGRAWGTLRLFGTSEPQTAATELDLAPEVTWGGMPRLSSPRLYLARPYQEITAQATLRVAAGQYGDSWGEIMPMRLSWGRVEQDDVVQHRVVVGMTLVRCGPSSETCIGRGVHIDDVRVLDMEVIVLPGDVLTWGLRTIIAGFDGLALGDYRLDAELGIGLMFLGPLVGDDYSSVASPLATVRFGRSSEGRGTWTLAYSLMQEASIDDRLVAEHRFEARWRLRGLETGLFFAHTGAMRWKMAPETAATTGHWLRYVQPFGDHVRMSFDTEIGRSYYGDLEGDAEPRASWGVSAMGRLTVVAGR